MAVRSSSHTSSSWPQTPSSIPTTGYSSTSSIRRESCCGTTTINRLHPTSAWKPGQTVEYTRTVFVPNYPYIGEATIRLGLYDRTTSNRLTLNAPQSSRKEYVVAKFQLQPQSENIFLIYKDGWHPAEVATDNAASEWQWTKKTATISFKNPKKDAMFYLEFDARTDLFTPPQQVTIRIGLRRSRPLRRTVGSGTYTFPITAAQLGTGDMTELVIDVDRTFTPGNGDIRETWDSGVPRLHRIEIAALAGRVDLPSHPLSPDTAQVRVRKARLYGFWTAVPGGC